jgi:hypothetical protein
MLVEYIKNIIDNDKWEVELIEGKYIVKQIIDCKECSLIQAVRESLILWKVVDIKEKLKHYLPKDVIYEVKYELINAPKPKIRLYGDIDVVNNLENYTHIRRLYDNNFMGYGSWNNNVPVLERSEL